MSVDVTPFQQLYPFAPQYLDTPAGRLHYVDEGPKNAPTLLMLHGNPTWSFYYRDLVKAFSDRYRVVVPDHIGCGRSDKPSGFSYRLEDHVENVERLVDHLKLSDINLVVHDWGGAIGMGLATKRLPLVKRFVVFNTAAFLSDRMPASINLCRVPGFGAFAVRGLNAFCKVALMRCVHHRDRLTKAVRAGYLAPYGNWEDRIATLRFVEDIPMNPSHPTHPVLSKIDAGLEGLKDRPMLIVWGARDFVFNDHFYEEWRRRFPSAETHYVEDAGHYVVEDAHERIVPWMTAFLETAS